MKTTIETQKFGTTRIRRMWGSTVFVPSVEVSHASLLALTCQVKIAMLGQQKEDLIRLMVAAYRPGLAQYSEVLTKVYFALKDRLVAQLKMMQVWNGFPKESRTKFLPFSFFVAFHSVSPLVIHQCSVYVECTRPVAQCTL